jgi:hypothetical protein
MTHVVVDCPECGRHFVVNGRGKCRCGVYLLDHMAKSFTLTRRTYVREDNEWRLLYDPDAGVRS